MNALEHFFPEVGAGGYSRVDGIIEFYGRINALLRPEMVVLDYGAGRGRGPAEDPCGFRRELRTLRGKCKQVIGIDVDQAVEANTAVDKAFVVKPGDRLPVTDASVDIIVSDAVFEHIAEPNVVASELEPVLKPGGWICARTPNRWGYIGVGANLVPNRFHVAWLKYLQPEKKEEDTFPVAYKLNTRRALQRYFPASCFSHYTYGHFPEPAYFAQSKIAWAIVLGLSRVMPESLAPVWLCSMRKL